VVINGMTTGPYAGFAVIYDRNNTRAQRGTGLFSLRVFGAFYAARALVDTRGNGDIDYNGAVVTRSLEFSGFNAVLRVRGASGPVPPPSVANIRLID